MLKDRKKVYETLCANWYHLYNLKLVSVTKITLLYWFFFYVFQNVQMVPNRTKRHITIVIQISCRPEANGNC